MIDVGSDVIVEMRGRVVAKQINQLGNVEYQVKNFWETDDKKQHVELCIVEKEALKEVPDGPTA